jgi:hypothetical protein
MVEDFLKRSALSANNERLAQIIEEFMDPAKYEAFVQELNIFVDQLLETP